MTERNEVKVAGRDIRIYIGECCFLFQKFDQIILSAGDKYIEKLRYISNILAALGVEIESNYLSEKKKIIYKTEECEEQDDSTGRRQMKVFHKLGLTKIPDLFMYTNLKEPVDIGEVK